MRRPIRSSRPVKFIITGGAAALVQLTLLALLAGRGVHPLPANAAAYIIAAQVNFLLSQQFTWRDRPIKMTPRCLGQRWLIFHGAIAGTAVLNMLIFVCARLFMPSVIASACGIGVAAVVNYLAHDRLTFRTAITF